MLGIFRVFKPGGRLVVLDSDWGCLCCNAQDYQLMQKAIEGYMTHCPHPYFPRTLKKNLEEVGFTVEKVVAHPVINTEFDYSNFSTHMVDFVGKYLVDSKKFTQEDFEAWKKDLQQTSEEDKYFFCLNRFVFVGSKEL